MSHEAGNEAADIPLDAKIAFLSRREVYPEPTKGLDAIETHMSWVFLTDDYVYKLKKPFRYDHLDFSSLAARHRDCQEELRLNRRLAADVYLDLAPLTIADDETLRFGGPGPLADWLVRMRRLPDDRMLDKMIAAGTLHGSDAERLGGYLADFYRRLPAAEMAEQDYLAHYRHEIEANLTVLLQHDYAMPLAKVEALHDALLHFLSDQRELLAARVREGRIVEGHGDLRPEHVCLGDHLLIIDSLTFNPRLRLLDPFDELAFLAMECERLSANWIGPLLLGTCCARLGDAPPDRLIDFYKCFRALLRARLVLRHLDEPTPRDLARWPRLAVAYLNLAEQHARSFLPARVVI